MADRACPEWLEHERNATIFMRDRSIPYPLQRNFGHLPSEEVEVCLEGLRRLTDPGDDAVKPENFEAWLRQSFGDGLYDVFMEPYNYIVWAYPYYVRIAAINAQELMSGVTVVVEDQGSKDVATKVITSSRLLYAKKMTEEEPMIDDATAPSKAKRH